MATAERTMLRMIAELHVRGYQRLRIIPHIAEVGAWRCGITPATNVRADHGALPIDWEPGRLPQYSSASGTDYFEWGGVSHLSASQLAERFIARFPDVAAEGYGPDWAYAGWYIDMLHRTYPDALPIATAAYLNADHYLATTREGVIVPLPPPGWATVDASQRAAPYSPWKL